MSPATAHNARQGSGAEPSRRWGIDWWLVAFTIIGFGLRFATIDTRGFWLDEALTVRQATDSVPNIISTMLTGVHPPLFHILMHYWIELVGVAEVPVRCFALIFGVAAIPAAYWAGRRMFDRRVGRYACGMLALWPYHIWYSQEARMYSMLMFFALLSVGCLYVAIEENTFGRWATFWFVTTLGSFVHYFFFFVVIGEVCYYVLYEVIRRERQQREHGHHTVRRGRLRQLFADVPTLVPWLLANGLIAATFGAWTACALFLPRAGGSALVESVSSAGLGYGQVAPSFAIRFNDVGMMVIESIGGFHPPAAMYAMVAMWPLAIYVLLLLVDLMGPMRRQTRLLLWSSTGIPVVWLIGQWQGQVLASRYFMPMLAPVLLLAAAVVAWMPRRTRRLVLVVGLVLALVGYVDQSFDPNNVMRYDNRESIAYVVAHYKIGDTVIYEPFYTDALYRYYLPNDIPVYGFPQYGKYTVIRDAKVQIGQDLQRVTGGSKRVWLILSFQDIAKLRGDAYNTEMWFLRNGYREAQNIQMNQVQVIRYDYVATTPAPETSATVLPSTGATPTPSAAATPTVQRPPRARRPTSPKTTRVKPRTAATPTPGGGRP